MYFRGLGVGDYDLTLSCSLTISHFSTPATNPIEGIEELRTIMVEERASRNTVHHVFRRMHNDEITMCEGDWGEEIDGDSVEGCFIDIFGFDDDTELIGYNSVYKQSNNRRWLLNECRE